MWSVESVLRTDTRQGRFLAKLQGIMGSCFMKLFQIQIYSCRMCKHYYVKKCAEESAFKLTKRFKNKIIFS